MTEGLAQKTDMREGRSCNQKPSLNHVSELRLLRRNPWQPVTLKVPLELQKLLPLESKTCLFRAGFIPPLSVRLRVQVEGFAEGYGALENGWRCNGALCWKNSVMPPSKLTGADVKKKKFFFRWGISGTKSPQRYSTKK